MTRLRAGALLLTGLLGFCSTVFAAADGSQVPLPAGVGLAIVVFEDLQCPDCARAHPELMAAAEANRVPLVIHDFPITRHLWAFPAAILARYFGAQSPELGLAFRSFIFENQRDISPENLRQWGEKFAQLHDMPLPADVDPEGRLQAAVQADFDLGRKIGLEYVPLMFVSRRTSDGVRAVEVMDPRELSETIARLRQ